MKEFWVSSELPGLLDLCLGRKQGQNVLAWHLRCKQNPYSSIPRRVFKSTAVSWIFKIVFGTRNRAPTVWDLPQPPLTQFINLRKSRPFPSETERGRRMEDLVGFQSHRLTCACASWRQESGLFPFYNLFLWGYRMGPISLYYFFFFFF